MRVFVEYCILVEKALIFIKEKIDATGTQLTLCTEEDKEFSFKVSEEFVTVESICYEVHHAGVCIVASYDVLGVHCKRCIEGTDLIRLADYLEDK